MVVWAHKLYSAHILKNMRCYIICEPLLNYSLLIAHYSLLIAHYSLLITHYSLLITHYSLFR